MASLITAGAALAAAGIAGRALLRYSANIAPKFYRGGFEANMTKREASLILGVSPNDNIDKIKKAHRRIMVLNHPDLGGSPYMASKINEAKDILEKK